MQQKNLENDIRLINDQIQTLNVSNGMPNIAWINHYKRQKSSTRDQNPRK
jgi:hypothetical protein